MSCRRPLRAGTGFQSLSTPHLPPSQEAATQRREVRLRKGLNGGKWWYHDAKIKGFFCFFFLEKSSKNAAEKLKDGKWWIARHQLPAFPPKSFRTKTKKVASLEEVIQRRKEKEP